MVADVPTLEPLPADLRRVLTDLLACDFCIPAFLSRHPADVALLAHPLLQAHIAALRSVTEDAAHIQATLARQRAMALATQLAENTFNPVEKRKNVTLLFRTTAAAILPVRIQRLGGWPGPVPLFGCPASSAEALAGGPDLFPSSGALAGGPDLFPSSGALLRPPRLCEAAKQATSSHSSLQ